MRLGGNGLGNLLFTWARCLSAAHRHDWQMIWPTWFSYKRKNWRTNPYDVRTYLDLFNPTSDYITGPQKAWQLIHRRAIAESSENIEDGSVVVYRGMNDFFEPFRDDHKLVLRELLAITRDKHLAGWQQENPAPIAIHVRRGDFITRTDSAETVGRHNSLLPMTWYVSALEAVLEKADREVPVWLFSDGVDEELEALTSFPNVERVSFGSSIADMLAIARCRFLIASGSTFSMWGTYLGQVPTLWHPGKMLQSLVLDSADDRGLHSVGGGLEFEWSPNDQLPDWVPAVLSVPPVH